MTFFLTHSNWSFSRKSETRWIKNFVNMYENSINASQLKILFEISKMSSNIMRMISTKKMRSKSHINVKWNRNKFKILNVLIDIQNHILKTIQRITFLNFKMFNRHVIDKHFNEMFTSLRRCKIDRNIYSKIRFLQFKIHLFRNVFLNILRVQFSIFRFRQIRNFWSTTSITTSIITHLFFFHTSLKIICSMTTT